MLNSTGKGCLRLRPSIASKNSLASLARRTLGLMTIAQQSFPSPQSWKGEEIHIIPLVPSSRNKPIERKKRIDLKNMRVLFPLSFYSQFHSGRQLFFFLQLRSPK